MYLDDGLGIEQDDVLCKAVVNQVKCDLINSGLFTMEIYQTVDLVRYIIDSEAGFYKIPDQRIDKIVSTIYIYIYYETTPLHRGRQPPGCRWRV